MSPVRRWMALCVLVLPVLLISIDMSVLGIAVPALSADLDPTSNQLLWIVDLYSFLLAGLLVFMGSLGDRIGRKKILLIGAPLFGAASLVAAFSTTPEMLIVGRALLGIGGATLMPSTLGLIRAIFPDRTERRTAIAVWATAFGGGAALGPAVGGLLLEHFWWGSVFLVNLPVIAVVLIAGAWLLPESRNPSSGRFDLLSSGLSMLAIIPLVLTIKQVAGGSADLLTVLALLAGVTGCVLFVRRQRRTDSPMIDVGLFRNPAFSGAVLVNFTSVFALSGALFFFSQYLQLARHLSPLQAGLAELPAALASMAAALLVGVLMKRLGRGRAIALALMVGALGLGLLAVLESSENLLWVLLALVPLGLGIGISETLSVDAVVSAVPPTKAGAASSISETAYELGVALGIAVLGSIMTVLYRTGLTLPADVTGAVAARATDSLSSAAAVLADHAAALTAAEHAFVSAMQVTSMIGAAVMVVGAVIAFRLIPSTRLPASIDR